MQEQAPEKRRILQCQILRLMLYHFLTKFGGAINAEQQDNFNDMMRPLLLQSGVTPAAELGKLETAYQALRNAGVTDDDAFDNAWVNWALRVQLTGIRGTYTNFMKNDSIPESTYNNIEQYLNNDTDVLGPVSTPTGLYEILEELLNPSLTQARYIVALCGATFICLAIMNLIQSWPRDRFHWGLIFSRFGMGIAMLLLLLLNIGKYQHFMLTEDQDPKYWASVFHWVDTYWVLPTIAIAYALQFVVDTLLTCSAVKHGKKRLARDAAQAELPENKA